MRRVLASWLPGGFSSQAPGSWAASAQDGQACLQGGNRSKAVGWEESEAFPSQTLEI